MAKRTIRGYFFYEVIMTKVFSDVQVFMQAAGQSTIVNNPTQAKLYHKLIVEEFNEFTDARLNNDEVEEIDACFDMIWVIVGYMLSKGWDCDKIWDEGALSNLRKIDKDTKQVLRRDDGKILKPEGWQPPDFSKFVNGEKV
jgi:predicted HAD superfamily Cof-like phosphohydrolase